MATFSQSTAAKGSDSVTDFYCSPCLEHNIYKLSEFYCHNCLKFYCGKCINLHGQLFGKHVTYGRGDTSKWPVSKEVEDFLQKCDLHEDKRLEMFCYDHSQLCCTNCAFINHRHCSKVTLISESVKDPPPNLQKLSRQMQYILGTLQKLENNWNTYMQTLQASYNKPLDEIRQTRQTINTILDKIEKNTIKELDDKMTSLKASINTDLDHCCKLKNELKRLNDAIHDIVDKGKAELSFIASKKCLYKIKQSETYVKENSVEVKSLLKFKADIDIDQFFSKLSCLGKIVQDDPDQLFTVLKKSLYNVVIQSDLSKSFDISAICVLSNRQILFADDNNQRVKLLNHKYGVVGHCDFTAYPSDMCSITPSEVAVALNKDTTHQVQFVLVNGEKLVKGRTLHFQHRCSGIAHNQKELYLTTGTALYKYSMSGALLNKVYEDTSGILTVYRCAFSPKGDKIFVTNIYQHKICTLDRDGTVLYSFTDPDLYHPYGIHVTAHGQVLVCGGNILQLDGEGKKKLGTLAYSWDGSYRSPVSVCFKRSTASILVGHFDCKQIMVLKLQ